VPSSQLIYISNWGPQPPPLDLSGSRTDSSDVTQRVGQPTIPAEHLNYRWEIFGTYPTPPSTSASSRVANWASTCDHCRHQLRYHIGSTRWPTQYQDLAARPLELGECLCVLWVVPLCVASMANCHLLAFWMRTTRATDLLAFTEDICSAFQIALNGKTKGCQFTMDSLPQSRSN